MDIDMIVCPSCGASNSPDAKWCTSCGVKLPTSVCYCPHCGKRFAAETNYCDNCGTATCPGEPPQDTPVPPPSPSYTPPQQNINVTIQQPTPVTAGESPKSRMAAALLCFFLGGLGVHRFYVGKVGTGILWLFTAGIFGIGWFIDFIVIMCGSFRDGNGLLITVWDR